MAKEPGKRGKTAPKEELVRAEEDFTEKTTALRKLFIDKLVTLTKDRKSN